MSTGIALQFTLPFKRMSGIRQGPPPDPLPQTSTVRKNLFGPIDHEENLKFVQDELNKITQADCKRWNFDFQAERPKEGRYNWKPVMEKVPQAYEMRAMACARPTTTMNSEQTNPKPDHLTHPNTTTIATSAAAPLPPPSPPDQITAKSPPHAPHAPTTHHTPTTQSTTPTAPTPVPDAPTQSTRTTESTKTKFSATTITTATSTTTITATKRIEGLESSSSSSSSSSSPTITPTASSSPTTARKKACSSGDRGGGGKITPNPRATKGIPQQTPISAYMKISRRGTKRQHQSDAKLEEDDPQPPLLVKRPCIPPP